jgi:hypothetical protein
MEVSENRFAESDARASVHAYTLYPVLSRTFISPASLVQLTVHVLLGSLPNAHALQIHIEI